MSAEAALAELKSVYGRARTITVQEAGQWIGRSREAAYKLATRDRFPVPVLEMESGSKTFYMVSLWDLAQFIGGSGSQATQSSAPAVVAKESTSAAAPSKAKSAASSQGAVAPKRPRLPAMSKVLTALRGRIAETRAQLDLLQAAYHELEAEEIRSVSKEPKPKKPKQVLRT